MAIEIDGKSYDTDEEGYLTNLSDWNDQLANEMAKADGATARRESLGSDQFPA